MIFIHSGIYKCNKGEFRVVEWIKRYDVLLLAESADLRLKPSVRLMLLSCHSMSRGE
jgi:hypothetical protein